MAKIKNNNEWSDFFSWKMDLLKSFLAFLFTIIIFNQFINKCEHKWRANYDIKLKAIENFEEASSMYIFSSYDAIGDAYFWKNKQTSENIKIWVNEKYDYSEIATDGIKLWFEKDSIELYKKLDTLELIKKDLYVEMNSLVKVNERFTDKTDTLKWEHYKAFCVNPLLKKYRKVHSEIIKFCKEKLD